MPHTWEMRGAVLFALVQPFEPGVHHFVGPPAAITMPIQKQARRAKAKALQVTVAFARRRARRVFAQLVNRNPRVVSVGWGEVCQHAGSIQAFPVEGRVRERIDKRPAQLLRKEAVHTSETTDLGELCRVAEGVR